MTRFDASAGGWMVNVAAVSDDHSPPVFTRAETCVVPVIGIIRVWFQGNRRVRHQEGLVRS